MTRPRFQDEHLAGCALSARWPSCGEFTHFFCARGALNLIPGNLECFRAILAAAKFEIRLLDKCRRGPGVTPEDWQLSDLQEEHQWSSLNPSPKRTTFEILVQKRKHYLVINSEKHFLVKGRGERVQETAQWKPKDEEGSTEIPVNVRETSVFRW